MRARADDAGPDDRVYQPSDLVENVLALLEKAGVPAEVNDRIVKVIESWEFSKD